jgi:hypothetical protein
MAEGASETDKVKAAGEREKFSARTLRRARKDLGIMTRKPGFQGKSVWELPPQPADVVPLRKTA